MSETDTASLVAVRDRREQVIEWLSDKFASDVLDMSELDRRVDLAHQADSLAALDALVADLDMPAGAPSAPAESLVPRANEVLEAARPARKYAVAILGGVERKGSWVVARTVRAAAVMGGVSLDFREAMLSPGVTRVQVMALMGGVEIIVPPHVAVQADGVAILGGFEEVHRAPSAPDPDMPLLVISGLALMGGVEIKTRLPGESGWQAWKRKRRERRELGEPPRNRLGDGD